MSDRPAERALHVVVVTGLSGAGRSTALHVLDDLGFFCVDNLPPRLLPELVSMLATEQSIPRAAFGIDVRTRRFLEGAEGVLDSLAASGHEVEVLFLEAGDEALLRRFSETRRPHPLAQSGDILVGIQRERERIAAFRARARRVIDTSSLNVHDLRRTLVEHISQSGSSVPMVTRVLSFGFKYGIPVDADLVFDVRYLPNPHFVPDLKPLTGMDEPVSKFVLETAEAVELVKDVTSLLKKLLPRYEREGKSYLTVAIGCTGGRHRSVALAEAIAREIGKNSASVVAMHRDATKKAST